MLSGAASQPFFTISAAFLKLSKFSPLLVIKVYNLKWGIILLKISSFFVQQISYNL